MTDTRYHILDVAERMFSERGIGATSLRGIMNQAGVNPAAIHYHFGGKDALVRSVIDRRVGPINAERLRRFDELATAAAPGAPAVADVIEAFVAPALLLSRSPEQGGAQFMRLLGRFYHESGEAAQETVRECFGEVVDRFATLLREASGDVSSETLAWRVHFVIGTMSHTMACRDLVKWIDEDVDDGDVDTAVRQLVAYCTAGFHAAAVEPSQATERRRNDG